MKLLNMMKHSQSTVFVEFICAVFAFDVTINYACLLNEGLEFLSSIPQIALFFLPELSV